MMRVRPANHSGFTLIELLLYIAIVPIILTAAVGLFFLVTQTRIKSQTVSEVQQQGSYIAKVLSDTIESADSITAPVASGNTLSLVIDGQTVTFELASGELVQSVGGGPAAALHNAQVEASNLTFTNLTASSTPGSVHFEYTLSYVNNSGRNEYSFDNTFYGGGSLRP